MEVTKEVLQKYGKKDADDAEEDEFTMMGGGFVDPNITSNKDFSDIQELDQTKERSQIFSPTDDTKNDEGLFNRNIREDLISPSHLNKTTNEVDYLNRSNNSLRKNGHLRTPGTRYRGGDPNASGMMDQSMDQEYLSRLDDIEAQNKSYLIELEEQREAKKLEKAKVSEMMVTLEKVEDKLQQTQLDMQKNENLAQEKQRSLEHEVQMKEQQIQVLHAQIREKQILYRDNIALLEEKLEIESENGFKLE